MNLRKKLAVFVYLGLVLPILAMADTIEINNPLKYSTFDELVNAIINFIFNITIVLAPLMIIIGAFYFVTAAGETKRIETGKNLINYALIGLIIVLLAKGLIAALKNAIGVQ